MILFLTILIVSFSLGFFFPWWILIPVVFLSCLFLSKNLKSAFFISFSSIFFLWLLLNTFYSIENGHILSRRIAELLGAGNHQLSWLLIILLGPIPGAIPAGLAGVSGFLAKQLLFKSPVEDKKP